MACCPSSIVSFSHFLDLLQNHMLDCAETLWEALWQHGDSEFLKSFVQISKMAGGHLERWPVAILKFFK